ncbi:MAG: hypothetical protein ACC662_11290, partial [Planctomycetota bacterium]
DNAQTVARLIRTFHKRQVEFIKDRGRLDKHREALAKLKSAKIDPDQSGFYVEYEKKWEETMYRTYERYVDAVEEWQKENRWHDGQEQLYGLLKTLLTKWMTMPHAFLGVGLPPFMPKSVEDLGESCLGLRTQITKAIEKFQGEEWAKLEQGLLTAEEERRNLRAAFERLLDKIEMDARLKADDAEGAFEKAVEPLEAEINRLLGQRSRAGSASERSAIEQKIRALNAKVGNAERARDKAKRYALGEWTDKQEEKAYKDFREAIRRIDDRVKELNGKKRLVR